MITTRQFGEVDGSPVTEAILDSGVTKVSILNYGCIFRDWQVAGVPVVLGFDDLDDYLTDDWCFGILAGRVGNRIKKGCFSLNGQRYQLAINDGPNHLHGGNVGLGKRLWQMNVNGEVLRLSYHSPDGEESYPCDVDFEIIIQLDGTKLTMDMQAKTNGYTPINLAQHNYYNLNGAGDVLNHELQVFANSFTETDAELIPTGRILPVQNTHRDFRKAVKIGLIDPDLIGLDDNLVLNVARDSHLPAATLRGDNSGLTLRLWTDQPGLQVFNAPALDVEAKSGRKYKPFCGLAMEPQHFPDTVNHPEWAQITCTPERPYVQKLVIDIA